MCKIPRCRASATIYQGTHHTPNIDEGLSNDDYPEADSPFLTYATKRQHVQAEGDSCQWCRERPRNDADELPLHCLELPRCCETNHMITKGVSNSLSIQSCAYKCCDLSPLVQSTMQKPTSEPTRERSMQRSGQSSLWTTCRWL